MRSTYVVLALGLLAAAFAAPAAAGPAEKMLPEDTLFVLSVDDFSASWERMKAHPLYALYNEPEIQKFLEKPLSKFTEMSETSAVKPGEFIELITGQGCFAVTGSREVAEGTKWMGVVALFDVGENEAKFLEKFKAAEAEMFETETHRRVEEEFRGVKIVTYLPREGEAIVEGAGTDTGPDCWFMSNGICAISSDPEVLKSLIVRRDDPEAKGLGANEEYKAVLARLGGTGDMLMYVNAKSAWKLIEENMDAEQSAQALQIMRQVGVMEPTSMGLSVAITPGGMDQKVYIRSAKPRTGVMKMLDAGNSALMPPRFVPPDVTQAVVMTIDFQELWKETRRIMDEIQPGMTEQVDQQMAMMKEQIGIDIQADFIGSLGKSITMYQFEPKPADPDAPFPMPTQRVVFAIEVTSAEKMQQCMDIMTMMAAQMVGMPETEDYMGVQIKSFNTGFAEIAIAIAADHVVFSATKDDLKQLVRSLGKEDVKALVDSEDFRKAMSDLPRMRNLVTYSDSRRTMEAMVSQLQMAAMMQPEMSDWLDVSLLPVDLLKKYLNVSGAVMVNEEEGVFIVSRGYMNHPKAAPETPEKPAPATPEQPK